MDPILSHTRVTPGEPPAQWLYLLHGIYGSGRNWGTLARRLVEARPDWGVILVDLRLHGDSTGFAPPHTVRACAEDLARLEGELDLAPAAILGHSFGGKVALVRACGAEPRQAWVVDSTLQVGEPSGSPWAVIEIVRSVPTNFASRDEAVDVLTERGLNRGIAQWLAMNIERAGDEYRWRLDWAGVEAMLRDYYQLDVWPIIENPPAATELHFIRATESSAIDGAAMERLTDPAARAGGVHLHEVTGGHWLNVDNPEGILELLRTNLPR